MGLDLVVVVMEVGFDQLWRGIVVGMEVDPGFGFGFTIGVGVVVNF